MLHEVKCLFSWDTEYSADSAEFCPIKPYQDYLAVGTYQLADSDAPATECEIKEEGSDTEPHSHDVPKKRLGRLYLKHLTKEKQLKLVQCIDMPAILDMKWCQHEVDNAPVLAIANASGNLLLYKLKTTNSEKAELVYWCKYDINETGTLALSLDWSSGKYASDCPFLSVSDSTGKINLLRLSDKELTLQQRFEAHEFEAWITAFDYWNPHTVYTGGDDCKFRKFDTNCDPSTPVFTSRVHNAGVTSLHCSAHSEHLIASGSYDETVNVWDTRKMRSPLSSVSLGGGIWRLKWEPHGKDLLLAACMHNGYHVADISTSEPQVVASFTQHESLAYGVDWWSGGTVDDATHVVASASFYDHLLCLWEFTIE